MLTSFGRRSTVPNPGKCLGQSQCKVEYIFKLSEVVKGSSMATDSTVYNMATPSEEIIANTYR